jgi:thiamine monophosphate kinase
MKERKFSILFPRNETKSSTFNYANSSDLYAKFGTPTLLPLSLFVDIVNREWLTHASDST